MVGWLHLLQLRLHKSEYIADRCMGLMYPVDRCIRSHMKCNCTGELGNLGSTQVEVVGAGHNPLNKSPLELRHQNRTQLISAAQGARDAGLDQATPGYN